jgi:hypothetical protein
MMQSYPPTEVLPGEAHNERFEFGRDAGPARRSTYFEAVKFAGNEPAVPGEDGLWFGDTGDLLKRSPDEPLADFSKGSIARGPKAHTGGKVSAEDAILSCEVFIL